MAKLNDTQINGELRVVGDIETATLIGPIRSQIEIDGSRSLTDIALEFISRNNKNEIAYFSMPGENYRSNDLPHSNCKYATGLIASRDSYGGSILLFWNEHIYIRSRITDNGVTTWTVWRKLLNTAVDSSNNKVSALGMSEGGTGATSAGTARQNLEVARGTRLTTSDNTPYDTARYTFLNAGTVNAARPVWFSSDGDMNAVDTTTGAYRVGQACYDYDANGNGLTYNPDTKTLTVGTVNGNAATATSLADQTQVGHSTKPVYFYQGKPLECSELLAKSALQLSGTTLTITL